MKLAFVLAAASLVPALAACSDPPAEPAQAAVDITVSPAQGTCNGGHGSLTIPNDTRVADALLCDLSTGCKPGQYVAVDGDTETRVSCQVTDSGGQWTVRGSVSRGGDSFSVSGQMASTGGKLTINHYYPRAIAKFVGECDITVVPNKGVVKGGSVWAKFSCPAFGDPTSPGGNDCTANGEFLFEKCEGG